MTRRTIHVPGLDHGTLPIPVASEKDGMLATGGINGIDPATGQRPAAVEDEIEQVYANIEAILGAAGFDTGDVLKVTFFVGDRDIRSRLNPGWLRLFPDPESRPARHTLVQDLAGGTRLQAELIAYRGPGQSS